MRCRIIRKEWSQVACTAWGGLRAWGRLARITSDWYGACVFVHNTTWGGKYYTETAHGRRDDKYVKAYIYIHVPTCVYVCVCSPKCTRANGERRFFSVGRRLEGGHARKRRQDKYTSIASGTDFYPCRFIIRDNTESAWCAYTRHNTYSFYALARTANTTPPCLRDNTDNITYARRRRSNYV